jgi:threonylcarbamoyladenosine tRNA methylthiotransferase MtaB
MPAFFIQQFGCRATQADGAAIERQLLNRGYRSAASPDSAEVVVFNTCTVTASADAQARDAIRKVHAACPKTQIIVTGCYAQRVPQEIAALPGVTLVVGNSHKSHIPNLIASRSNAHRAEFVPLSTLSSDNISLAEPAGQTLTIERATSLAEIIVGNISEQQEILVAPVVGGESNHTRPTLKIQDGCNNRCAFCVIPFVRGKSRSLPPEEILHELRNLSAAGYQEIVLSGINLGAWGRDLHPRQDFLDLLRNILGQTDVARLRLSSIEPLDVTRDMVNFFASSPRLAQHFHMPLQSGSDKILAAMHRWYRSEHYARRIEFIQEQLPNAAIGADVIAGFPGETEKDHLATMNFIESRPFTYLHVFSYSVRPGTGAVALPNHVPPAMIRRRACELRTLSEAKTAAFHRSQAGRVLSLLTLRHSDSTESAASRCTAALSANFLKLRLAGGWAPNQFVNAICPADPQALADPVFDEPNEFTYLPREGYRPVGESMAGSRWPDQNV